MSFVSRHGQQTHSERPSDVCFSVNSLLVVPFKKMIVLVIIQETNVRIDTVAVQVARAVRSAFTRTRPNSTFTERHALNARVMNTQAWFTGEKVEATLQCPTLLATVFIHTCKRAKQTQQD